MKKSFSWLHGIPALLLVAFVLLETNMLPAPVLAAIAPLQKLKPFTVGTPRVRCVGTHSQVILTWRKAATGASYVIERSSGRVGAWTTVASKITRTRFVDTTAPTGQVTYRITANNTKTALRSLPMAVSVPTCAGASSASASSMTSRIPWGAFVGWQPEAGAAFERLVGAQMHMRAVFVHWGNERDFPMELKPSMAGKPLIIFWEAFDYTVEGTEQSRFSYDAILRGDWDTYFVEFANDAKRYRDPVILIPFEEMNGDWYASSGVKNGNTPAKHIKAYRYVHDFFEKVPNVQFGWAVNSTSVPDTAENAIEQYYPGNAYVDIVGVDGFNFDNPWMSFNEIFGEAIITLRQYKKPIYIFSMASADGPQKAAWVRDALTVQIPQHPEIKGWVWFNENKERDWRVWSDEAALKAFKAAVSSQ